jgi:hypothetical protein
LIIELNKYSQKIDNAIIEYYLFFAITLQDKSYSVCECPAQMRGYKLPTLAES